MAILSFLLGYLTVNVSFAENIPPIIIEMKKDILTAQEFVKENEIKVLNAKDKVKIYRDAICKTEKEFCKKEILDPLNTGVDLSVFLNLNAKL